MLNLYNQIESLCKSRNIKMADLARLTDLSKNNFSDLKHGRKETLSIDKLIKISDYFEISLDELVGRKKEAPSPERDEAVGKVTDLFNQMTEEQKDFFLRLLEQTVQQAPKR